MGKVSGPKSDSVGTINSKTNVLWVEQRANNLQRLWEKAKKSDAECLYQAEGHIRTLMEMVGRTGDDPYGDYLGYLVNRVGSIARKLDNKKSR